MNPQVISVNVGTPQTLQYKGRTLRTSIFKSSIEGPVFVTSLGVTGNQQADLTVHGGYDKAVYAYPTEHYAYWQEQYPTMEMPWGTLGENLSIAGLDESGVYVGDRLHVGTVVLEVSQPRGPCQKLAMKFDSPDVARQMVESGYCGFYLRVIEPGEIGAGDLIERRPGDGTLSVSDALRLNYDAGASHDELRRASRCPALPEEWRDRFRDRAG